MANSQWYKFNKHMFIDQVQGPLIFGHATSHTQWDHWFEQLGDPHGSPPHVVQVCGFAPKVTLFGRIKEFLMSIFYYSASKTTVWLNALSYFNWRSLIFQFKKRCWNHASENRELLTLIDMPHCLALVSIKLSPELSLSTNEDASFKIFPITMVHLENRKST